MQRQKELDNIAAELCDIAALHELHDHVWVQERLRDIARRLRDCEATSVFERVMTASRGVQR